MEILWPSNTEDTIDAIRDAIGREITFHYVISSYPCPDCDLDPISNVSKDSFCLTCSGYYWIPVYGDYNVKAHVTWQGFNQLNWVSGGQIFDGDCRVQLKYTDTLITVLDKTEYVNVDLKKMDIVKQNYGGFKEINRVILDLSERE